MSKQNTTPHSSGNETSVKPMASAVDNPSEANPQLSDEDLARVERYLASPIHSVERKPFKTLLMMFMLVAVVIGLGMLSILISWIVL